MRLIGLVGFIGLLACDSSEPQNTAPGLERLLITPSVDVHTTTQLTCDATTEDKDRDSVSVSYMWSLTSADGATLTLNEDAVEDNILSLTPDIASPTDVVTCTVVITDGKAEVTDSVSVSIDNSLPVITSFTLTPNEIGLDTLIECLVEAEDADGETLDITYSWTQNGLEVGTESSLQLNAESFSDGDILGCTVTATDAYGGVASETQSTMINNTAPSIGSLNITPFEAYSFDTLTCSASDVVDLENNDITVSYTWLVDGIIQSETSNTLVGPFNVGSTVVCEGTPNDGFVDGNTKRVETTILNTLPTLDSIAISPNSDIEANGILSCSATGSDVDDPTNADLFISYQWRTVSGGSLGNSPVLELDPTVVFPTDIIECVATASDPNGGSDSETASVTVLNTPPTLVTATSILGTAGTGSTLLCDATFEDINDASLTPMYEWSVNGTIVSTNNTYTIDSSDTEVGDSLTCSVSVTDYHGSSVSSSATVTVANASPSVGGLSLSPDPLYSTSNATCLVGTTADEDGDFVTVSYEWAVNGVVQSESSNILGGPFAVGSEIECRATPNDGNTNGTTKTTSLIIQNTEPVVKTVDLDTDVVLSDGIVTAVATLSDVDSTQSLSSTYTWLLNSVPVQSGISNSLEGAVFVKGDIVQVEVTPYDGIDYGTPLLSSAIVIGNTDPSNISATIVSSDNFHNDSTLTCSATADDLDVDDGVDTLSYSYTWSTGDTGDSIQLDGSLLPGDSVSCEATASDGTTTISNTVSETIANRAPTTTAYLIPQTITATTNAVFCVPLAEDVDGETPTVSYSWTIDGNQVAETSNTLTQNFTVDNLIECTVTPMDATESGTPVVATKIVDNTVPTVESINLDSGTVLSDGTVTATAVLSDIDSSQSLSLTATYEWFINDISVQTGASNTLNGALFTKGDSIQVEVLPYDSIDYGAPLLSSAIVIGNTDPSNISSTIVSSDNFYNDSTLTCSATADDLDVDDGVDTLSYSYTWSTGDTGDSIQLDGSLLPGDSVSCEATASDGTTTISNTTTETIGNRAPSVTATVTDTVTAVTGSVTCTESSSDLDGTTPTISYAWTISGNPMSETSNVLTGPFDLDEVITCTVMADDGITIDSTSASVTVSNTPPVVISATIPLLAYTDDALTATVNAIDIDTEQTISYTYEWFVNGTSVQTGITNTLGGSFFSKGDSVYVSVTPNDGRDNGNAASSNVLIISNSDPTIVNTTITPQVPVARSSDLTCSVLVTDADSDTIYYTYEWSNSDGTQQTTTNSISASDTLSASDGTVDTWTCSVSITDGTASDTDSAQTTLFGLNCVDILLDNPNSSSGTYTLYPDGTTAVSAYCDMSTDGGGYDSYLVTNGLQTNSYTDPTSCPSGMDIVVPRTKAHWDTLIDTHGQQSFTFVPGIYNDGVGDYRGFAMNSEDVNDWMAVDGGDWWLRDSSFSEPSGDYTAGCWMYISNLGNTSDLNINDDGCNAGGTTYVCSTNAKEAPQNCLDILETSPDASSGDYTIYPNGSKGVSVYCDMTTDGGGYDSYVVNAGATTYRYTDNNSCAPGMDIVVPRTQAHWDSLIAAHGTGNFPFVPGIYGTTPGNYTNIPMNSDSAPTWLAIDGGTWWLRDTPHSEPSGDYTAGCWLEINNLSSTSNILFNDGDCRFGSSTYVCSTNIKNPE